MGRSTYEQYGGNGGIRDPVMLRVLFSTGSRKTHLQHLAGELDDFADQLELWIIKFPQVWHDHERPTRFTSVWEDILNGYAVFMRVLERSQELRDFDLLAFILEALDCYEPPIRGFRIDNVQLLFILCSSAHFLSRTRGKLTIDLIESSQ